MRTFLLRLKWAALDQIRRIPPGIRQALVYKAVRHTLTGLGGWLAAIGWDNGTLLVSSIGAAAFGTGVALSVLDAYLVDEKIEAAGN